MKLKVSKTVLCCTSRRRTSYIIIFAFILLGGIAFLSLADFSDTSNTFSVDTFDLSDKLIHLIMYCCLSFAIYGLTLYYKCSRAAHLPILIFAVGYGSVMEYLQSFVPWRSCDVYDILANTLGAMIAYYVITVVLWYSRRK